MRGLGAILLLSCAGCAAPRATVYIGDGRRPPTNLALDRDPRLTQLAEEFSSRSDWPAVDFGYVVDQFEATTVFSYDDQSFYDRLGGAFHRAAETIHIRSVDR